MNSSTKEELTWYRVLCNLRTCARCNRSGRHEEMFVFKHKETRRLSVQCSGCYIMDRMDNDVEYKSLGRFIVN